MDCLLGVEIPRLFLDCRLVAECAARSPGTPGRMVECMWGNLFPKRGTALRRLAQIGNDVRCFSVGGIALLLILGVCWKLGAAGSKTEAVLFVLMGTAYPALLLATCCGIPLGTWGQAACDLIAIVLAAIGAWGATWFLVRHFDATLLILALASALLWTAARAARMQTVQGILTCKFQYRPRSSAEMWARLPGFLVLFLVLLTAWFVAVRLLSWSGFEPWVAQSLYRVVVLLAAVALVTVNLGGSVNAKKDVRSRWSWLADAGAILLAIVASLRLDTLGAPSSLNLGDVGQLRFFHWGAVVGSAELVRQGGWLLWDVPSSYGFLSTLSIAFLPLRSVWQSYYVLQAALTALSAAMLFFTLRSLRTGPTNYLFSLSTMLAAVFLVPGITPLLTGPSVHPPLGAFRYIWCYALVAVLIWQYRAATAGPARWSIPLIGNVAWLLGTLWSPESAIYCAAIWLPAYAIMGWGRSQVEQPDAGPLQRRWVALARWLVQPPLWLFGAWAAISTYYWIRLGHGPDWARYLDYIVSFTTAAWGIQMHHRPDGAIWSLVLVGCAISTFAVAMLRRRSSYAAIALTAGVWGTLWSASGYYVMRANELFLLSLSPVVCLCMALALGLMARERVDRRLAGPVRASMIPILVTLLTMGFGNGEHLSDWAIALRRGYVRRVERLLPAIEPELAQTLARAGVKRKDPITFLNYYGGWPECLLPLWVNAHRAANHWSNRAWLPATPFLLFVTLPKDRPGIYMERFAQRVQTGGWLIESKRSEAHQLYPWFFDSLARTHVQGRSFEDAHWRVTWYDPQVATAARDRGAARR